MKLAVPQCYFAKYHNTEPQVEDEDSPPLSDAESVLVLEDMRPNGYSMRDFNCGLSLDETFAALREIATVHALSWAMQETSDQALDDKWEFAYRPQKAASAYKVPSTLQYIYMIYTRNKAVAYAYLPQKSPGIILGNDSPRFWNLLNPFLIFFLCIS